MTDLVERLRDGDDLHSRIEAADRIETLEAEITRLREQMDDMRETVSIADGEYAQLKAMVEQGVSIDGEFIPLVIEGGLVDRSVGIDEPPYLTVPDAYDTPDVREALHYAHREITRLQRELGNQPRVRMCLPGEE